MNTFFQRLKNPGGRPAAETAEPRIALAAFGKHPGWNDHIPGIGVETESLAHVKHAMYVTGIGGRIDSGAWKALEAEKRLEGFDHTFLWLRDGHVILGRMYSSEDGLHRKEYPMVLCVDSEGVTPEFLLAKPPSELDCLRNACQATASAEQVTAECRTAEGRLRSALVAPAQTLASSALSGEVRKRFLEHAALGPDRIGLLRVLHELGSAGDAGGGRGGASASARSRHLRVPLAADSRNEALLLWAEFLRCAVAAPLPVLLIYRNGVDWLDVIVGEPVSDDFFCLQASPKALPLASQIPYDLTPELKPRLQELEARFLRVASAPLVATPVATSPVAVPPPIVSAGSAKPPSQNALNLRIPVAIGVVILVGGLGVWLFSGKRSSSPEAKPPAIATNLAPAKGTAVVTEQPASQRKAEEPASETVRLKAEAESKQVAEAESRRLAEEKKIAEARAAEEMRLKTLAAEKAKVEHEAAQAAGKKRTEDDKLQARARENDGDLAQIALSQGNYERATEICRKWPEVDRFQQLLKQIASETNQLWQAGEMLAAGDYDRLLSQHLPENSKSKEILTKAGDEKKILNQASAELVEGKYAFLQRTEVVALKSKPPFQRLLQDGAMEAGHLKKAQGLKAEDKPQAALDFIVQTKLQKPAFALIQQWAKTELARKAGEKHDRQSVEDNFRRGEYAKALELCRKYSGMEAFDTLSKSIGDEQSVLANAGQKFSAGDYSFTKAFEGRDYKTKPPFADLLRKGVEEQAALGELEKFKQAGDWQALQVKLGVLLPTVSGKKPFDDLRKWAQARADEQAEMRKKDPVWLDAKLEVLLVRFKIFKPTDPRIKTPAARQEKALDGALNLDGAEYYLKEVTSLENEYKNGGWLDQGDRKKLLKDLKEKIKYGN